ncbi:MAG: sulfite exporter TauE/SafE family protein [Candidatus Eremiobacterota bacterium]
MKNLELVLLGLVGSLHCLGMCSGFVLALKRRSGWYQVGRLAGYATMGAILGGAGLAAAGLLGLRWWMGLAGALMVLMGLGWLSLERARPLAWLIPRVGPWVRNAGPLAALTLGGMASLLPCGLLYVAYIRAAASASPAEGGALLASFWLGTLPALAAVAWLEPRLRGWAPRWWPRIAMATTVALGALTLYRAVAGPACCP